MTDHSDLDRLLGPDRRVNPPRGLAAVVVGVAVLVVIGLIALWPGDPPDLDLTEAGFADHLVRAETDVATVGPCSWDATFECRLYQLTVLDDPVGDIAFLEFPDEVGQPELTEGDVVHLAVVEDVDGTVTYQFSDKDRRTVLWVLGLVFAAAVIALGRLRGVAALAGLALSVGVLLWFILPAIIEGSDAVLVALIGGGAIALISLYLAHGYNPLTHVAALGAFSALVLTTVLSWLVVELARFSGLAGEEAFYLLALPDLDLNGLLLAGIVLGAIGALDDVTVTQASAVWEVRAANPSQDSGALFESGLRVGRDHIVSTVNTLLLAYAGASLPLLVFLSLSEQSLGFVASSEVVAVEIVRTLVGSIGLVAAVPLTTWLASRVAANAAIAETSPRVSP
ncbi:MAG TPA: YibE/F family protein [Acidimicrobiia bacterium]|nr:YibE/F family protein [Acidimicrobiia bacterium]